MWSYIAGGLNIEVQWYTKLNFGTNRWSSNQGGLKIKGCKMQGPLYTKQVFYVEIGNCWKICRVVPGLNVSASLLKCVDVKNICNVLSLCLSRNAWYNMLTER